MLKIIQTVLARKARDIVSLRNPFTFGIFLFTYPFCLIKTRIYWGQCRDFFLAVRVASRLYRRRTGMHVNFYVNLPKLCFWMANETELLEGLCPSFFDPQIFFIYFGFQLGHFSGVAACNELVILFIYKLQNCSSRISVSLPPQNLCNFLQYCRHCNITPAHILYIWRTSR